MSLASTISVIAADRRADTSTAWDRDNNRPWPSWVGAVSTAFRAALRIRSSSGLGMVVSLVAASVVAKQLVETGDQVRLMLDGAEDGVALTHLWAHRLPHGAVHRPHLRVLTPTASPPHGGADPHGLVVLRHGRPPLEGSTRCHSAGRARHTCREPAHSQRTRSSRPPGRRPWRTCAGGGHGRKHMSGGAGPRPTGACAARPPPPWRG